MAIDKKRSSNLSQVRHIFSRFWKKTLVIVLVVIGVYFGYKFFTAEPKGITTSTVKPGFLISSFSANGKIKAKKEANLKFLTPGKVSWVGVERGDTVSARQSVASLSTISLNASYQIAKNNLTNYEANAASVLDNVQGHDKDETFAQRALRTTAEVSRDNAYDSIKIAGEALSNAVIFAPFAGTVMDTNGLEAGTYLVGSDMETKFIRIVDLKSVYFEAKVDEVDYSKVKIGQEVNLDIDAFPGQECLGKVEYISRDGQETAGGVVTIPVEISIEKCSFDYATGLNGRGHFVVSKSENVLTIPRNYIVNQEGSEYVWKQTGKTAKNRDLVQIEIGNISQTEAEVKSGLTEGDTIIFIP